MKLRIRKTHKPLGEKHTQETVSIKNMFVLFLVCVFVITSIIMLFLSYGGAFTYVMILLILFIAGVMSFFIKQLHPVSSIRQRFFFTGFSILSFVLYFSIVFQNFGILFFLILFSLGIIFLYLICTLIHVLFDSKIKYKQNSKLWQMVKQDINFMHHHRYYTRTRLREEYNKSVFKNDIKESLIQFAVVLGIFFIFLIINSAEIQIYITFFILLFIFFIFSVIRSAYTNLFKTRREKLSIYSTHLGEVKYYHKKDKNIFFY